MVKCSEYCIPCCESCIFAVREEIEDEELGGTIYGEPVFCELHPSLCYEYISGLDYCEDYHCIYAGKEKNKTRAVKRRDDFKKAVRKRNICKQIYGSVGGNYYKNLHQYSKNKIHCSCPLCRSKTNDRKACAGPAMNWSERDKRRLEDMREQETTWLEDFQD